MENNTPDSKLDETVKSSMDSYEANYDAADWSRMEKMLDAAPKSITTKGSYNIALIVGAVILIGGALIYRGISSSKTTPESTVNETVATSAKENKTQATVKPAPAETVVVKTSPTITPEIKPTLVPEAKIITAPADKTNASKKQKTNDTANDFPKNQKVTIMGNEPIFGDMIDSSKGIIHETKEKESTKKAAKAKGTSGIGFSGLMNLNADSIKKQKEMLQKDTTQPK